MKKATKTKQNYIEDAMMFRKTAKAEKDAKKKELWWWAAHQGIKYARSF